MTKYGPHVSDSHSRRRWIAAVLVLALSIPVLVPVGFMPMFAGDFAASLAICDGGGALTVGRIPAHHHGGASGHSHGHVPCPYGAGPAPAPTLSPSWSSLLLMPIRLETARAHKVLHLPVSFRAQSPRGPPLPA